MTGHSLARHFATEACNNAWANHLGFTEAAIWGPRAAPPTA